jgi:hypothetical protein
MAGDQLSRGIDRMNILWYPQVTASIPLSAYWALVKQMRKADQKKASKTADDISLWIRLTNPERNSYFTAVTPEFFKENPQGLKPDYVKDKEDLMGFLSLIVSVAKSAHTLGAVPPKYPIPIMPRTDFSTIYGLVKKELDEVDLFSLVETLACYRNDEKGGIK